MQKIHLASRVTRHLTQAKASYAAQRFHDCIRHAEQAEKIDQNHPDTYYWRALSNMALGATMEARRIADEALEKFAGNAVLRILAGEILMDLGLYEQAKALLESAIGIDQSLWAAWSNYSAVLYSLQDYYAAKDAALRALALAPANAGVLSNYANTLKETGDVAEAVAVLRKAIALSPRSELVRFSLLFTMLFDENTKGSDILREAQSCAALLAPARAANYHPPRPKDSGRIRLGLLSNDLYAHVCAYFIIPFLANLDHSRFEVHVFSLNGRQDNVTQKIQYYSDRFVDVSGQPEGAIIETIRDAALDVLIDMGGYTRNTPLRYMAYRLAAIQLTWMGYPGSTGMRQIDYRLTDWSTDPAGNEAHHTEQLLRAPVVGAVYYPLVVRPLAAYSAAYRTRATPALANGYVTYGCCINIAKISTRAMRLWGMVLARSPGSKLLVECAGLDNDAVRVPLLGRMTQAGIDSERVICVPRRSENQYLMYHNIDVVLDTTPMTGGANACDALWMGVPIVTLSGQACHERLATSYLHAVGLDGLICQNEAEYVDVAAELAADVAHLNALRMSIRPMFEASPLFDAAGFCRWFETEVAGWVGSYRQPGQIQQDSADGVFFNGRWHPMEEIIIAVVAALRSGNDQGLENLLENISAKWSKHWLVAYALSEFAYRQGDKQAALDLLIESANLRKYSLPLYRLLLVRLDECGQDKTVLDEFLQQAFGLNLAYLEGQPVPSMFEIAGIPDQLEEATA